jgi:hypothetical protein
MSNSLSFWKFIKLHENLVEIHPIWWPPDGFCSPTCWVWFQIQFFVKHLCNYMKRWLKYVLFGGHYMCFGLPSHIELSPKLKLKSKINWMCFTIGHWRSSYNWGKTNWLVVVWIGASMSYLETSSFNIDIKAYVRTLGLWIMLTIVCGWGFVGSMVDSWHKCYIVFLWKWFSIGHVIQESPCAIHHPQPNIRVGML